MPAATPDLSRILPRRRADWARLALLALPALLLSASPPRAAARTLCTVASSGLGFGGYDIFAATATLGQASVNLACTRSGGPQRVTVTLSLSLGQNATGLDQRALARSGAGAERLRYQVYQDAALTQVWGPTPGLDALEVAVNVPNNGSTAVSLPMFGAMPAGQDAPVGLYTDRLTLTVTP